MKSIKLALSWFFLFFFFFPQSAFESYCWGELQEQFKQLWNLMSTPCTWKPHPGKKNPQYMPPYHLLEKQNPEKEILNIFPLYFFPACLLFVLCDEHGYSWKLVMPLQSKLITYQQQAAKLVLGYKCKWKQNVPLKISHLYLKNQTQTTCTTEIFLSVMWITAEVSWQREWRLLIVYFSARAKYVLLTFVRTDLILTNQVLKTKQHFSP